MSIGQGDLVIFRVPHNLLRRSEFREKLTEIMRDYKSQFNIDFHAILLPIELEEITHIPANQIEKIKAEFERIILSIS